MTDLRLTIAPKSDQLNSDDLIGGPRTITVTKVSLLTEADQPIAINFEGDNSKPYKPCKSMRRVMVSIWGPDGGTYPGKSMTIYRDAQVQFGGMAVGGIRISHMSHIDAPITLALTATRANRKPFTVKPLVMQKAPPPAAASISQQAIEADASNAAAGGVASFTAFWNGPGKPHREALRANIDKYQSAAKAADAEAEKRKAAAEDDPFGLPPIAPSAGDNLSAGATNALTSLRACANDAELESTWEALPVEICRELGAGVLDEIKAGFPKTEAAEA